MAGVFNERLLKGHSGNVSLGLQNVFMYLDSSLCNLLVILFTGNLSKAFSGDALSKVYYIYLYLRVASLRVGYTHLVHGITVPYCPCLIVSCISVFCNVFAATICLKPLI